MRRATLIAAVICACVEWTRLAGTVKAVNLKAQTVTILSREGDLFNVPVDYQVRIGGRRNEPLDLKDVRVDEKVTLTRIQVEPPEPAEKDLDPNRTGAAAKDSRGF